MQGTNLLTRDMPASPIIPHRFLIRHGGMTFGELAKMFNSERGIDARLTVIPMQGWMRGDWFDSTGLDLDQPIAESARPDTDDALSWRRDG